MAHKTTKKTTKNYNKDRWTDRHKHSSLCQIFSRFPLSKNIKIGSFLQSYLENKNVNRFLGDSVFAKCQYGKRSKAQQAAKEIRMVERCRLRGGQVPAAWSYRPSIKLSSVGSRATSRCRNSSVSRIIGTRYTRFCVMPRMQYFYRI